MSVIILYTYISVLPTTAFPLPKIHIYCRHVNAGHEAAYKRDSVSLEFREVAKVR